jgi:hypothetical protein
MKTTTSTEDVSSDGMEKCVKRRNWRQIVTCAREKPRVDWKKSLQICGAGRKSRKRPTPVVGKKPYGKSQLKLIRRGWCLGGETFRQELLARAQTRTGDERVAKLQMKPEEQNEFNLG